MNKRRNGAETFDPEAFEQELFEIEKDKIPFRQRTRRGAGSGRPEIYPVIREALLLEFLLSSMPDRSRTAVKSYLTHRRIRVNEGIVTRFDYRLIPGDVVSFRREVVQNIFRHPMLSIVYEDDYLLVVHKKNGLLSMATDRERTKTAYYILSEYVKSKGSGNRIFIVHRLDRETSGLMLFAKSIEVQHRLQQNWNDLVLEREYVAVVSGMLPKLEGTYRSYLAENKAYVVYSVSDSRAGELAVTHYRVLQQGRDNTLVALGLETGKKNQIRVHMKDMGCPIVGDKKYGGKISPIHRLALHARSIRFLHPVTNREMSFDTPVPESFYRLLK